MYLFDLHCDTLTKCFDNGKSLIDNEYSINLLSLSKFDKCTQTFAIFTDDSRKYTYEYVFSCIDYLNEFLSVYNNHNVTALLSLENLAFIGDDLSLIHILREKGIRIASLTWNDKNQFASGVGADGGLTLLGKKVIKTLNDCGMILDISHLNDVSFNDIARFNFGPVIATHSNCRAICDNKRNLTECQIKYIVENKGLIGLNFYPLFVNGKEKFTFDDLFKHIDYLISLNAKDCISIGSDFDGCKMNEPIKSVNDLKILFSAVLNKYGIEFAENLFYNNAYIFFKNLE